MPPGVSCVGAGIDIDDDGGDDGSGGDGQGCGIDMIEDCAGRCFSSDVIGQAPGGEFGGYWGDGYVR